MPPSDFLLATVLRELNETTLYQRGVLDVLRLLGLVTLHNGKGEPTGEVAQMVLRSLAEHADAGASIGLDWNNLDENGLRGVDILRVIEAARMVGNAARSVCVVQAVVKARRGDVEYYLMQYDSKARQYQPIGGKVEETDADSESALCREIAEELELERPIDSDDCVLTLLASEWKSSKISPTYGVLTNYTFDIFHVSAIRFPIVQTGYTRWLRRGEIERSRADDSRPISTLYLEALGMERLDALEAGIELE